MGEEPGNSRDMPPYRAILVVDARGYGDGSSVQQQHLNAEIEDVLAAAFSRAGLADVWRDRRFPWHEGDSYVLGCLPEKLPHLLHPLLRELQTELEERDHRRYALAKVDAVYLRPSCDGPARAAVESRHLVLLSAAAGPTCVTAGATVPASRSCALRP